jgi:hypothetical protein
MERRMDTRLGERVALHRAIRIVGTRPPMSGIGRLLNLSRSGAFIAGCDLQLFSLVHVDLDPHQASQGAEVRAAAYVTRVELDGVGVEWCEFAPAAVIDLLRASTYARDSLANREVDPAQFEDPSEAPRQKLLH